MALHAGFDMGGTELKYGLVNNRGKVLFSSSTPTPERIPDLWKSIESILKSLKEETSTPIASAGFGFPGIFDIKKKMIHQSPNYQELNKVPIEPILKRIVDVPFTIHNDANMAAYGEHQAGAGHKLDSMVLLTIGTGVGSGVILGGKLWEGACGFAGELGHITVNPGGEPCNCGSQGCLETEVSGGTIVKNYQKLTGISTSMTAKDVFQRARKGDKQAEKAFSIAGTYLGIGLSIVINLLNPEKILLGGGVMKAGKLLLDPTLKETKKRAYSSSYSCCSIEKGTLGNQAGFIGAALWAKKKSATLSSKF
ncbi:MAG: ROK family protein [Acidobacteriota bacterium]